jgi:2-Cys peroxiredoxin 5
MKAWGVSLDATGKSGIRFLGDPTGKFSEALDVTFDSSSIFGNQRSKRYALVVEDGKVKEAYIEPDNTGVNGMHIPTIVLVARNLLTSWN